MTDDSWKGDSRSSNSNAPILIQEKTSENSIGLSLTIEDDISSTAHDAVVSRGSQYFSNTLNEFKVAAFYFNEGDVRDYFVNSNGRNGLLVTDGVNTEVKKPWPYYGTLDFLAVSPKEVVDEMPSASAYNSDAGASFAYTIASNDIKTHTDIIAAITKGKSYTDANSAVPLQFEHLLAAVQFKVGKMLFIKTSKYDILA